MSVVKGLVIGIVLVAVGLGMLLSSSQALLPYIGGLLGLIGAGLIVRTLLADHQSHS